MTSRIRLHANRLSLLMCLILLLGGIGMVSLYRQATSHSLDAGFAVVDAACRIAVRPGGVAEQSGLRSGDRLTALDGEAVDDPYRWSEQLLKAGPGGIVSVQVRRGGDSLAVNLPLADRSGGDPIYYYLALVGFFFLTTAAIVIVRRGRPAAGWEYFALSLSIFAVLSISDTPQGEGIDWLLFAIDRLGRLTFPVLFVLFARALTSAGPRRLGATLLLWTPSILLGAVGASVFLAGNRALLRDPLGLWVLKDRAELLVAGVYLLVGLGVLGRGARRELRPGRRYQLRWAFWGSAIGVGPFATLYLIPVGLGARPERWTELSALTLIVLPMTLSGALFGYRPGDLELYLKRLIGWVSVGFLTIAVFEAASVLLDRIGRPYLDLGDWVIKGLAVLVAAILYPKLSTITHQAIDRLIYGGRYSFRRTLLSFGRELNSELDLEALVRKFQQRTRETLDLVSTLLLVRHDREAVLRPVSEPSPTVSVDSPLVERIRDVSYMLLEDLARAPGAEKLEALRAQGIQYLFPMKVKGEIRAVLATGPRRGGEALNSEDVELLVALCGHAAIAIESARLFAAVQGKVNEVERLRRYNEDILESSRIGILVVDAEGSIQALNQALVEIYGAAREEAIGRSLGEVFPLPLVRRLSRTGPEGASEDGIRRLFRYSLTDRRGRRIIVNLSISRLAAAGGDRAGRVITFDDVTEQVKLEEQVLRQDRLASIGLLASGVAHEVNTPLTGISSYTQMLLADLDPADPRYEVLRKIEKQTFRAASIVHSLLNFTRDGSVSAERIRVAELIDESLALFEPQLREGKVRVERTIEEGLPLLPGNRSKLQQVLLNLLMNARDAIPDTGTIRVAARRSGGRLELEVADDGEGIAEEDLPKIFDPFFTTKPRGRGTGLGLSLSYNIVREHRGEISVESRRGEGSVFTIDLPLESRDAVHA